MRGKITDIETPYGLLSLNEKSDAKMAAALRAGHYPNEELLEIARRFVKKGGTVVDIGAHVGTFAVAAAGFAKVVAFEPAPETFALLQKNAASRPGEIEVRNKGLAAAPGSAHVVARSLSNAGSQTLAPGGGVVVSTLDAEVEYADFIKIDVEGMELQVLSGGAGLIERARPVVFFEVNLSQLRAHGSSPRALERFFTRYGYRLYVPLAKKRETLARVRNATLLTALMAPRAWLFFSDSAPFDLVAIPKERVPPLPIAGFMTALLHALWHNLKVKRGRILALFR